MDDAGFSIKPQKLSASSMGDIPEALRDTSKTKPPAQNKVLWGITTLVSLGAIAATSLWYVTSTLKNNTNSPPSNQPVLNNQSNTSETVLGHFVYLEAPQKELKPITADGRIQLRQAAAKEFKAMVVAARASGVTLVPISGFRSVTEQQHLFFDIKAERGQLPAQRAAVSAPPGYSEHHTGYAVDVGDGTAPATNLNTKFDKTRAFKWLSANAARFSFELSFTKNNFQGVNYEPWHWRYVGDRHSLETFYKAKNLQPVRTP